MLWAAGLAFHRIWTSTDVFAADSAMMMLVIGAMVAVVATARPGVAAVLVAVPCAFIVLGLLLEHHVLPLVSELRQRRQTP